MIFKVYHNQEKISLALKVPLSRLFEKLSEEPYEKNNIPLECYELLSKKTKKEQTHIYKILLEIDNYKKG